jgi:gas vesicle structural protein
MAVERAPGGSSLIDVLDRILDKGIVVDAWVRISLVGIDLITVEARVVIASIDTYLKYAEAVGITPTVSRPALGPGGGGGLGGGISSSEPSTSGSGRTSR